MGGAFYSPKNMDWTPNTSWLHGKYYNAEIDTRLGTIHFYESGVFLQGDEGYEAIRQIHQHWTISNCSVADSVEWFIAVYL
jgi:hypothetical protein